MDFTGNELKKTLIPAPVRSFIPKSSLVIFELSLINISESIIRLLSPNLLPESFKMCS